MSYDLNIVTSNEPDTRNVEEFFSNKSGYILEGKLKSDSNIVVSRQLKSGIQPGFVIDGPLAVEAEDLEDNVLACVLSPKWMIQITIPSAATKKDFSTANALARNLAQCHDGVVYDPQLDKVIFPKGKKQRYKAQTQEEKIRLVKLEWFMPYVSIEHSITLGKDLLGIFRVFFPEAIPRRFGTYEPLQGKFDPEDDNPFLEMWEESAREEIGEMLFWKSTPPCFGGTIFLPDQRDNLPEWKAPPGSRRTVRLALDLDGRALHSDERWCDVTKKLFTEMSKSFGAFFSAAYVERNVIATRSNSIWYDGSSEGVSLGSSWWCGLPKTRTWLTWFGKAYKPHVEKALKDPNSYSNTTWWNPTTWGKAAFDTHFENILTEYPEGILLCLGEEPMDIDQLKGIYPKLTTELLASNKFGIQRIGFQGNINQIPVVAKFIPEFDK